MIYKFLILTYTLFFSITAFSEDGSKSPLRSTLDGLFEQSVSRSGRNEWQQGSVDYRHELFNQFCPEYSSRVHDSGYAKPNTMIALMFIDLVQYLEMPLTRTETDYHVSKRTETKEVEYERPRRLGGLVFRHWTKKDSYTKEVEVSDVSSSSYSVPNEAREELKNEILINYSELGELVLGSQTSFSDMAPILYGFLKSNLTSDHFNCHLTTREDAEAERRALEEFKRDGCDNRMTASCETQFYIYPP